MDYNTHFQHWLRHADAATAAELGKLNETEREECFYTELEFGTAGLRGILGPGPNRMNIYVVRRATQGLCRYLSHMPDAKTRGVAIAYDSRHYSERFALETALTLCANGYPAYLFDTLHAVPQLSFTVQHLNCIAGVVITASHNPSAYNGYKVYWEHGGQIGPAQAAEVFSAMHEVDYFDTPRMEREEALRTGLLRMIGKQEDDAYYAATQSLLLHPELLRQYGSRLHLVYTPLHGAGNVPVTQLLRRVGLTNLHVVSEQAMPDGCFPTVTAPNPEDPNAFVLGETLANAVGADVIFATDPDADRLGVAVRNASGAFQVLAGNQIGVLLLEYILSSLHASGSLPQNGLVVRSIVSTDMADAICARYGVACRQVLTGFRFISEWIDASARSGSHEFIFGFEESFGFLAGGFSRDKDAIGAAMLMAELYAVCLSRNKTLCDALQDLYATYGYYKERTQAYTLSGKVGMERIASVMSQLRVAPLESLIGAPVCVYEDYETRQRITADGVKHPLSLPQTNMLRFLLEDESTLVIRPSGTEPKLKLYISANRKEECAVDARLDALYAAMDAQLRGMLGLS